jgi:diguanylate cyclase (GGDEF)-like protein/PAS domain S-box-containing protein
MKTKSRTDVRLDVLMNLHTGVVVHAPDTSIIFSNHRASELLGLSEDQMLGKRAIDPNWCFIDNEGNRLAPERYPVSLVLSTLTPLRESVLGILAPDRADIVWVIVSAFPDFSSSGQLLRVVVNFHDISQRKKMEAELEKSRAFAHSILDGIAANVCVLDEEGKIVAVNQAWKDFYVENGGDETHRHEGDSYLKACTNAIQNLSPELQSASQFYVGFRELIEGKRDRFELEYPCHSPKEQRWFFVRVAAMRNISPRRIVVTHVDISAQKRTQEHLQQSLLFSKRMIDALRDGVSVLNKVGVTTEVNPALCKMTGFSREELLGTSSPYPYWPEEEFNAINAAMTKTMNQQHGNFDLIFKRKNGERFPVSVAASTVFDEHGQVISYIATVKDISEYKKLESEIQNLAFYDPLTNLPNRRLLNDRIGFAINSSKRTGKYAGLMMLDLDNFKPLNDQHGHDVGDLLLVEAAHRLRSCIREVDTVARFGGDEFVIVINELHLDKSHADEYLVEIAEKVRSKIAEPFVLQSHSMHSSSLIQHRCTASIGCLSFTGKIKNGRDLLKIADKEMYQAKQQGRNRVSLHQDQEGKSKV